MPGIFTPKVGDCIHARGRMRDIVRIVPRRDGGLRAVFVHPDAGTEASCALDALEPMGPGVWCLPGMEHPWTPREGAVQLEAAELEVNAEWHAKHGESDG